jgi:putative peptidoglycan lipid II flippase
MAEISDNAPLATRGPVARAALIIALGNVLSRVLGFARDSTITHFFGTGGPVSAFGAALRVPQMVYDLLVGGLISAALVPVFSEYATEERREELWRVASIFFSLAATALAVAVVIIEAGAPWIIALMGGGFEAEYQELAVTYLRWMAPTLFFLGLAGATTGLLYALKRFTFPAFATAVFNAGIVLVVLAAEGSLGVTSAALGVLLGSILQLAFQVPGLRDGRLRPTLRFNHPVVRRLVRLYIPVAFGVIVGMVYTTVDTRLASGTDPHTITWMRNATNFIQMALGLIAAAVSMAVLPSLSRADAAKDDSSYQSTLGLGLRLILTLVLPATAGLFALGRPLVALLFEHGEFTATDTTMVTCALYLYLISLPFAAVDQLLIYAFYGRKDTLRPNLVQAYAVAIYLLFALILVGQWGMLGLVLATSALWIWHALLMLLLLRRYIGWPRGQRIGATLVRALIASAAMGLAAWATAHFVGQAVGTTGLTGRLLVVGAAVAVAVGVYAGLAVALRLEEVRVVWEALRRRLGATRGD